MHVALYHHGRLPARGYGGTERVVVWLARGLAEAGHRVTLLAGPGSALPEARVVELDRSVAHDPAFDLAPYLPDDVDILHAHAPLRRAVPCPAVFTLHGNTRPGRTLAPNTIFVSADHARRHGAVAFVHNGLDPAEFVFSPRKDGYDLFLGRLRTVKGYRWAVDGARRSGRRLILAGGWRPSFRRSIRYVGEVDGARKAEWLARADCLWMPAQWDEPFGLTLIEALVSGTPVLGTRRGALPEVVVPEVGALGETLDELVALRKGIDRLDPHTCRDRVLRCFTHRTMADAYLAMYRHYLDHGTLPPGQAAGGS